MENKVKYKESCGADDMSTNEYNIGNMIPQVQPDQFSDDNYIDKACQYCGGQIVRGIDNDNPYFYCDQCGKTSGNVMYSGRGGMNTYDSNVTEGFTSDIDPDFKKKKGLDISQFKREKISNILINKYKDQQKSLQHLKFDVNTDGYIWIDKKNNKVVATLTVIEKPDKTRWIQAIEIGTDYRGYGLSKMVMNIATHDLHADHLSVSKDNKVAIKLYTGLGFKQYKNTNSGMIMMQLPNASNDKKDNVNKDEKTIKVKENAVSESMVDDLFFMFFESNDKDVPDLIEPIVKQLEKKGYQVKYSSPGYPDSVFKKDRNKDGIVNSKLTSTARVIFSRDYKFTKTPQGWEWKVLKNGAKALYVKPYTYNEKWGTGKAAQKKWQIFYIDSLKNWAASIPNVGKEDKSPEGDENFNK